MLGVAKRSSPGRDERRTRADPATDKAQSAVGGPSGEQAVVAEIGLDGRSQPEGELSGEVALV